MGGSQRLVSSVARGVDRGIADTPALAVFDGKLYMAWMGRKSAPDDTKIWWSHLESNESFIQNKYEQFKSELGTHVGDIVKINSIWWKQACTNGAIYYLSMLDTDSVFAVYGAIYTKYVSLNAENGLLGFPTSDGRTLGSTISNDFQYGRIIYNKTTNSWIVLDLKSRIILDKYEQFKSGLGTPVGNITSVTGYTDWWKQKYSQGVIYYKSSTEVFAVYGAIYAKYSSLSAENGFLGLPTTDERGTPDGVGRFNHFQGGSIYWTNETGAHEVHGSIRARWSQLGWETSYLGYPKTDEMKTPDTIGRYNHFQGGSIYWTPTTGTHDIHIMIFEKWKEYNYEKGRFGYPISDTTGTPATTLSITVVNV